MTTNSSSGGAPLRRNCAGVEKLIPEKDILGFKLGCFKHFQSPKCILQRIKKIIVFELYPTFIRQREYDNLLAWLNERGAS